MAEKGSNDLNLLLKAKVVKLKVELDYEGSKIPTQIKAINKYLENKPVKLKVKFDASAKELNAQIASITKKLPKTAIKLNVAIDVKGSADAIKKQLKEVTDVVSAFNAQYGKQIQKMQNQQKQAQQVMQKATKINSGGNVPTGTASVQGFNNIKDYVNQLKQAESLMKTKFGKEGIFSSHEIKDAKGNLTGFIAKLQSASGVIEGIRYAWNKDKGAFQVIDRTTATNTEKMIKQSVQALEGLQRELGKTGREANNLTKEYNELMKAGNNGTLTSDMVKGFDVKIKNVQAGIQATKAENDVLREQQKLIADITRARKGMKNATSAGELTNLKAELRSMKSGDFKDPLTKNYLSDMRKQFLDVKQGYADQIKKEKELATASTKRLQILSDIKTIQRTTNPRHSGALGASNLESIKTDAKAIRTMEDYIAVKKRVDAVNREKRQQNISDNIVNELARAKKAILDYSLAVGKSTKTAELRFEMLRKNAGNNLAHLTQATEHFKRQLADAEMTRKLSQSANSVVDGANHGKIKQLVDSRDINALKEYIGGINGARVATLSLITDAKGISKISAQLESTGKTAKKLSYEINDVDKKLRHMGEADVFNRNANLGVFEQLRIAMARVPVWMVAMTAFYGSINVVKDMATQILNLDKALTEIKRVASDNINIDTMFEGAVDMSKELGNNIHDIMASIGELARTFGDFNETQLLAITRTATLMSNVSDLSAEEATSSLVGTMNAFNIEAEESIRIVDSLNEVDNNYAISTKQLATGLQKSASTAKTFGVTMEETVGHITAIGAVTMESGNIIGNSLKTIYSRITTLGKSEEVLNSIGVDLKTIGKNGEEDVRPVNDILGDLALRWTDLSDSQRQNIAVQVAGRYQLSRFLALMNNYDMSLQATETAVFSQGSAMRENAEYMKSFEARINQLKNGWVELSSAVGDAVLSSAMMEIIRLLTTLAQGAVVFVQKFGALPAVLGVIGAIALKMGVFRKVVDSITTGMTGMQVAFVSSATGATRFGTASARSSAVASAGFGMLRTRAITTMATVKASMSGALLAVRTFSVGFQSILASTGIGLIFVAIGIAIEKLMKIYNAKKQKEEEMIKLNKKLVDSYRTHRDGMDSLVKKYEELDGKKSRSADEEREYLKIQKQLAEQLPTTVAYIDSNGKAHLKSSDNIKREVDAVKELSKAQAELTNAKFQENMEKKSKSYMKIIDNIDDLNKKQKELQENDGKHWALKNGQDHVEGFKVDNGVNIQQNKVEVLMAEAEKTDAIQKTMKAVQAQVRSHFEASNKMGTLGDQQNAMIENFIMYNEEMLRGADTPKEFEKAYRDLFEIGVEVGDVFSKAFDKMSKDMKDDPLALADLKKNLGEVAKAVPKTFFEMTDEFGKPTKSIKEITDGLEEIVNVSNRVSKGDGNWKGLVSRLQEAGMSADEAKGYLANLAREHDNAKLRAEAQAQGVDAVSESLEDLNEKAMEAIDLTQTLFGFNSSQLDGIKSHLQAMHLLADAQGEAGKASEEYKASQEAVTDFLNITNEELEKNKDKYYNIIEALGKLNLSEYDPSTSWEDFINASEIDKDMKSVLLSWDGTKNILTGQKEEIVASNTEVKKSVGEIKDVFEEKIDQNGVVLAIQDTKKEAEDTSWLGTLVGNLKTGREWLYSFVPKSLSDDIGGIGTSIGNFFSGLPADATKGMNGFLDSVDKSLGGLPSKTGAKMIEWGDSIKSWFTGLADDTPSNMDAWGNSIGDWFTNLPEKTTPKLEEWYTSIRDWFAGMPKKIAIQMGDWYEAIYDWFDGLPENTNTKLDGWWTSIGEWFDSIPEKIASKLIGWGTALTAWLEDQKEQNKEAYGGWWTAIGEWYDSIPEKIKGKLDTWKTAISDWFSGTTTFWAEKLDMWWTAISDWFTGLPERTSTALGAWWTSIGDWVTGKKEAWKTRLDGWGEAIGGWFGGLGGKSSKGLGEWWTSIGDWITDTKDKWKAKLDEWWTSIGDWLKGIAEKSEVKASGKDITEKIGEGIKDNKKDILEKISEIILAIPKYVMIVAGIMLLGLGREIIQKISKGVNEGLPALDKKWEDLKDRAKKKLGELATDAKEKGKSIVINMIAGIGEKANALDQKWEDLKDRAKKKIRELRDDIVSIAKSIPEKMGSAISGAVDGVEKGIKALSNKIASGIESGLNGTVVAGVNTVLKYMDVPKDKRLSKFTLPRYAKGTKNGRHAGGHAIVGEEGRELAHIPNKGMTVVGQQGSEIIDLPKGSSILPNKQTEIMLKDYGFPAYATGIGDFFSNLMAKPKDLMVKVFEGLSFSDGFDGVMGDLIQSGVGKVKDHAGDFVGGFIKKFFGDGAMGAMSGFGNFIKTSGFGMRKHPITGQMKLHAGQDFAGANNSPIHANVSGKVVASGNSGTTFGNWVKVKNGQFEYIYAHLNSAIAKVGQLIKKGQLLGLMGSTGGSTGTHLHYEVRKNGRAINPNGGGGRSFGGGGSAGAMSGEGGSASTGGDSGSSGVMVSNTSTVFTGGYNVDGIYDFHALATNKPNREGIADAFTFNYSDRQLNGIEATIALLEIKMGSLNKATVAYRDTLKSVIAYSNMELSIQQKVLTATNKRQTVIKKELAKLPALGKQSTKQREAYNKLMGEYDSNLTKINSLKSSISSAIIDIKAKSLEIFTDFIDEIVTKYDTAIQKIADKTDNIDFKLDVNALINEDDKKELLNLQGQKATEAKNAYATSTNKVNSLQGEYNKVAKSKGSTSKEALKAKEELDKAKEAQEDAYLAVLQAEKAIKDTRESIADEGIKTLQDYHGKVKDMALEAIDLEKEALQDAHDTKMELLSEEEEAINSVYDAKLKGMDEEKDKADYQATLDEKNAKKAELLNKIALLSRDTSIEGRKKLADAQAELSDVEKDIAETQADRKDELLRKDLEAQKQAQLDAIALEKEKAEKILQFGEDGIDDGVGGLQGLDATKEKITKDYEDLMNNDAYWAKMRDDAILGNFDTLSTELGKMKVNLDNMNKGIFDGLYAGFSGLSAEVKKQVAELGEIDVDNMLGGSKAPMSDVSEAKSSDKYTITDGKNISGGTKVTTPNVTTPPKKSTPPKTSTPPKKSGGGTTAKTEYYTIKKGDTFGEIEQRYKLPHGSLQKLNPNVNPNKLQVGQKIVLRKSSASTGTKAPAKSPASSNERKTTSALNMRKSPAYGNNVMASVPKDAKVQYVGMEQGWAKIKYNGKTGYVGAKYLKKFDTGGYTGDWQGNEGKVAMLHKKEIVLNERQTKDILDSSKIMDKITSLMPNLKRNVMANELATGSMSIVNNYELHVNIERVNGDKKGADLVISEVMKGLKKMGK